MGTAGRFSSTMSCDPDAALNPEEVFYYFIDIF